MDTSDLSHHILSRYNADLEGVRSGVLQMGGLVEQQLQNGVRAVVTGDSRLGEEVARLDHRINAMEVAIDDDCSRILATRGPTASDLRLIVAVIKTITDLERVGDEAEKLGRAAARLVASDRPADRYRELKHEMGRYLFHPELMAGVVETNLAVKNKVRQYYRSEEQRILDESNRILELESEVGSDPPLVTDATWSTAGSKSM